MAKGLWTSLILRHSSPLPHLVTKAFASQSLYSFHQWRCGNCWGGGGSWRFPSGVLPAVPRQVLASLLAIWFSQRHSLEEQMSDHSESVKQWSKVRTFIIMYMCMYKLCNYVYIYIIRVYRYNIYICVCDLLFAWACVLWLALLKCGQTQHQLLRTEPQIVAFLVHCRIVT